MTPGGELPERLATIEVARRAGQAAEAARLRRELVRDRLFDRVAAGAEGVHLLRRGDVALLLQVAGDLEREGEPEAALSLLRAGHAFSAHLGSAFWTYRVTLHGIYVRCAIPDLVGAVGELALLLALPESTLGDERALDAARSLTASEPETASESDEDRALLRAEAVFALARVRAATGALEASDRALSVLLSMLEGGGRDGLSRDDVALLLGELRVDRGDFAGFDTLRARAAPTASPSMLTAWSLVDGTSLFLQGRMSEARGRLQEVERLGIADDRVAARYRRTARWQLAQVSATLNYMDDAEQTLARLAEDGGADDVENLRALLAARRAATVAALTPDPTPRELWADSFAVLDCPPKNGAGSPRRNGVTDVPPAQWLAGAGRAFERVHDEWAYAAAQVQMDLDTGHRARAEARLRALASWIPLVQSPLLQARFIRLCALVAYFDEALVQDGTAETLAARARAEFERLGLVVDAWHSSRLRFRALTKRGASRAESDAEALWAQSVLSRIEGNLSPVDRRLFRLNKWSSVDDDIEVRLRKLAASGVRARRRATLRAAQEMTMLKRGTAPSRQHGGVAVEAEPPVGSDVFTWVREQARATAGRRARLGERLSLRPALMPADTALVTYTALPGRLEAFVLQREGCERLSIARGAGRRELFEVGSHALRALSGSGMWNGVAMAGGALDTLAAMLGLPEVRQALSSRVRRIVVELDDALAHLPFSALPCGGVPLVDWLDVAVTPYARWSAPRWRRGRPRCALGVAVPAPPYTITDRQSGEWHYESLGDPSDELRSLDTLSARRVSVLRDDAATSTAVLTALGDAELAHFICHGDYFVGDNDPCKLLLWDRPLHVRDLQSVSMDRLQFVAVGACWSGTARILPGREIVGMPTAFLEQGADAVLAALWQLPDMPAAEFARELYQAAATMEFAAAVSHVQRTWWRNRATEDWALYQMYVAGVTPRAPFDLLLRGADRLVSAYVRLRK